MNNFSKRGRTTNKNKNKTDYRKSANRRDVSERELIEKCKTIQELETRLRYNMFITKNIALINLCKSKIEKLKI